MLRYFVFALSTIFLAGACTTTAKQKHAALNKTDENAVAKNIIFMIVDGMGFEYIKAARVHNGQKPLAYDHFTCKSQVSTCAYDGADPEGHCIESSHVTDSAAAATAIATGIKVHNGVVSKKDSPNHTDIETILEIAKRQNKSTGVIATKLFTDATPAAFTAHAIGREMTDEILSDMFQDSRPNLVFGADTDKHRQAAQKSPVKYQFATSAPELEKLAQKISAGSSCQGLNCPYVYGGFGLHELIPGHYSQKSGLPLEIAHSEFEQKQIPHLSQMTDAALKILEKNDNGFFLMVESSMPDMIGHYNSQIDESPSSPAAIEVLIQEMKEVENTIKVLKNYVQKNPNTLVVLTADHETGGLVIEEDQTTCLGKENCVPKVRWTAKKYEPTKESPSQHTGVDVPLFALGQGSERFCQAKINNIDIKRLALAQ